MILTDPIVTDKKFKTKWNLLRANGSKHELLELKKLELNEINFKLKKIEVRK